MVQSSEARLRKKGSPVKKNNYSQSEEISHAIDKTYPEGKVEEKDILLRYLKIRKHHRKTGDANKAWMCSGIEFRTSFDRPD